MSGDLYSTTVREGSKDARKLGFPTVNLDPTILSEDIKTGIYAAWVTTPNSKQKYMGALYLGPRLVMNETHNVLEIHILDFDEDLYGQKISFELVKYIRGEKSFTSINALTEQIKKDIENTRKALT